MSLDATSSVAAGVQAPPAAAPAMSVSGLRIKAGEKELIHGVDAEFRSQQVSAIIGPTGSGKSTILRALNRLHDDVPGVSVTGGTVKLGNRDIYHDVEGIRELRRRVGMVFQRPNPFPQSIIDNITIGPRVHRLAPRGRLRELAIEKLQQVGLFEAVKDRLTSSPFSLSGGQQQLLCIARALSVNPDVILLDEPTSSLDPNTTTNIEKLIVQLKREVTVIMVSHNLGQVQRVADDVLFLISGSRVEMSPKDTFFDNPSDPRSRDYISGEVGKK